MCSSDGPRSGLSWRCEFSHNQEGIGSVLLYVIRHKHSRMEYIGTTVQSLQIRLNGHRAYSRRHTKSPLHEAIRRDGVESFEMQLLAEASSYTELLEMEQSAIRTRNTLHPNGYNLVQGGRGNYGWKMRPDTKARIRAKALGRRAWNKGQPLSPEVRAKLSAAKTGRRKTARQIEAMRNPSPTTRQAISSGRKAWWARFSPELRVQHLAKLHQGNIGKTRTLQTRRKLSENKKAWWASLTAEQRSEHVSAMTQETV